jgi:TP901 family phage tail tape measure protein
MGVTVAELQAKFTADTSGLQQGFRDSEQASQRFASSMQGAFLPAQQATGQLGQSMLALPPSVQQATAALEADARAAGLIAPAQQAASTSTVQLNSSIQQLDATMQQYLEKVQEHPRAHHEARSAQDELRQSAQLTVVEMTGLGASYEQVRIALAALREEIIGAETTFGAIAAAAGLLAAGFTIVVAKATEAAAEWQDYRTSIMNAAQTTEEEANKIAAAVQGIAGQTGISQQQLATAVANAAGQWKQYTHETLDAEQATKLMVASSQLALAANTDVATSTSTLIGVMKSFKVPAEDMAGVEDRLYNVSRLTGQGLDQIGMEAERLAARTGATAKGLDDILTSIVALDAAGAKGRLAIAGVTEAVNNLDDANSKASQVLERLGVTTHDANDEFVGIGSIITQLAPIFAGMSDSERHAYEQAIFGAQAYREWDKVISDGIDGWRLHNEAVIAAGTAQSAAAAHTADLETKMKALGQQVQTLLTQIGEPFLNGLIAWSDLFANKLGPATNTLAQHIAELNENLHGVPAAVVAALGPLGALAVALARIAEPGVSHPGDEVLRIADEREAAAKANLDFLAKVEEANKAPAGGEPRGANAPGVPIDAQKRAVLIAQYGEAGAAAMDAFTKAVATPGPDTFAKVDEGIAKIEEELQKAENPNWRALGEQLSDAMTAGLNAGAGSPERAAAEAKIADLLAQAKAAADWPKQAADIERAQAEQQRKNDEAQRKAEEAARKAAEEAARAAAAARNTAIAGFMSELQNQFSASEVEFGKEGGALMSALAAGIAENNASTGQAVGRALQALAVAMQKAGIDDVQPQIDEIAAALHDALIEQTPATRDAAAQLVAAAESELESADFWTKYQLQAEKTSKDVGDAVSAAQAKIADSYAKAGTEIGKVQQQWADQAAADQARQKVDELARAFSALTAQEDQAAQQAEHVQDRVRRYGQQDLQLGTTRQQQDEDTQLGAERSLADLRQGHIEQLAKIRESSTGNAQAKAIQQENEKFALDLAHLAQKAQREEEDRQRARAREDAARAQQRAQEQADAAEQDRLQREQSTRGQARTAAEAAYKLTLEKQLGIDQESTQARAHQAQIDNIRTAAAEQETQDNLALNRQLAAIYTEALAKADAQAKLDPRGDYSSAFDYLNGRLDEVNGQLKDAQDTLEAQQEAARAIFDSPLTMSQQTATIWESKLPTAQQAAKTAADATYAKVLADSGVALTNTQQMANVLATINGKSGGSTGPAVPGLGGANGLGGNPAFAAWGGSQTGQLLDALRVMAAQGPVVTNAAGQSIDIAGWIAQTRTAIGASSGGGLAPGGLIPGGPGARNQAPIVPNVHNGPVVQNVFNGPVVGGRSGVAELTSLVEQGLSQSTRSRYQTTGQA